MSIVNTQTVVNDLTFNKHPSLIQNKSKQRNESIYKPVIYKLTTYLPTSLQSVKYDVLVINK